MGRNPLDSAAGSPGLCPIHPWQRAVAVPQLLCVGGLCGGDLGKSLGRSEKHSSLPFASGGLGSAGLTTRLDDLRDPFQPKQFYDLWQVCFVPKSQTSAGVWWPHAELVRGECYLAVCPVLTNTPLVQAKPFWGTMRSLYFGVARTFSWCGFECIHKGRNGSSQSWGSIALHSQLV